MGMRAGVLPFAGPKHGWAELVEENKGANHAALSRGQSPANLKTVANIAYGRQDHLLDDTGFCEFRDAHVGSP